MDQSLDGLSFSGPSGLLHRHDRHSSVVGPGTYTPSLSLTAPSGAAPSFGRSHRFLPSAVQHISNHHNADLLTSQSPGPKYKPNAEITYRRAPTVSFGLRPRRLDARLAVLTAESADVGPAAYSPLLNVSHPHAPASSFGRADRFRAHNTIYVLNNSPDTTGENDDGQGGDQNSTTLHPNDLPTKRSAPRYSFGKLHPPRDRSLMKSKPRTSFMTHSVRGGLAKPATLECNIGPGDYRPKYPEVSSQPTFSKKSNLIGDAERFLKHGVQFISADHAKTGVGHTGPGPMYLSYVHQTGYTNKNARGNSLQWLP